MSITQGRTWSSEPTCVGRSGRQSRDCHGPPGWREARGGPHPSCWIDPLLAPVARQTGAHSRVGAVRRRWDVGVLLWLERVASTLGMVQSILIRWWTVCFRSHTLARPPSIWKNYFDFIPKKVHIHGFYCGCYVLLQFNAVINYLSDSDVQNRIE